MSYTVYDLYRDSYIKVKVTRLVNKNLFLSSNFFNGHEWYMLTDIYTFNYQFMVTKYL